MKSFSQAGQEQWVREYLKDKRDGYFVDIGAYDGVESSNTYYLEKELGWDGLCIESNTQYYNILKGRRDAACLNEACMSRKGHATFAGIQSAFVEADYWGPKVKCDTLDSMLKRHSAPKDIDYISLDVEGHEFDILKSFPFEDWSVNLLTIEHNLYLVGDELKIKIYELLTSKGYKRVVEDVLAPEGPYEDWYALF